MDLFSPDSAPPMDCAAKNDVAIKAGYNYVGGRSVLQQFSMVTSGSSSEVRKNFDAPLKRSLLSWDAGDHGERSSKKSRLHDNGEEIDKLNDRASSKLAIPLGSTIFDTLAEMKRMGKTKTPSQTSEDDVRIRRAEIAAILEQATSVAVSMGTSVIGETSEASSPMRRRRYHRRNSVVVHRNDGGLPLSGVGVSGEVSQKSDSSEA